MKFTLRTIALTVALVALALALILTRIENVDLKSKVRGLRESIGFRTYYSGIDEYRLSETGDGTSLEYASSPTYLLRVENFKEYQIEVTHYMANTANAMQFDIADPLIAISYFPDAKANNFFIRGTTQNSNTFHSAKIGAGPMILHSNHGRFGDEINEEQVILSIFLGPGNSIPFGKKEFQWHHVITQKKVERLCDACNLENISIRLIRR